MRKSISCLLASLVFGLSHSAHADVDGVYLGLEIVGGFADDYDNLNKTTGPPFGFFTDLTDYALGGRGAVGYGLDSEGFLDNLRLEIEGGFTHVEINGEEAFDGTPLPEFQGHNGVWSVMANGLLDIPIADGFGAFVGGGVGAAHFNYFGEVPSFAVFADDGDWVLAYQGMAGLSLYLSPDVTVSLTYRYFATEDGEIVLTGPASGDVVDIDGTRAHLFGMALRISLNGTNN